MATAAQKRRLLEGIAFIRSHRGQWDQGCWVDPSTLGSCGTIGCLAGHIAITLNRSRPIVKVPAKVRKKTSAQRTRQELDLVARARINSELLTPVKADDPSDILDRLVDGKRVPAIHVRERAARLIGNIGGEAYRNQLFRGSNKLDDICRIAAYELGITVPELKKECDEIAKQRGWDRREAKARKAGVSS